MKPHITNDETFDTIKKETCHDDEESFFYTIPAQIVDDKRLSLAEKFTMVLLFELAKLNGECIPSNEWLSSKLDLSERRVQEILESLEKNKYIKRKFEPYTDNPFKKKRIIKVIAELCDLDKKLKKSIHTENVEKDYE